MNRLLERKNLVRTSSTPGCTRQLTFFDVALKGGLHLTLVDMPGYGYARRAKTERQGWADLVESYLLTRPTLRAVVIIVDVRRGLEVEEEKLVEMLEEPRSGPALTLIVAATKLDRLRSADRKPAIARLKSDSALPIVGFSAENGVGREELWKRILTVAS